LFFVSLALISQADFLRPNLISLHLSDFNTKVIPTYQSTKNSPLDGILGGHRQAQTGTDRHRQARTGTDRHRQARTGTDRLNKID